MTTRETTVNLLNSLTVLCPVRSPFYISHYPHSHITVYTLRSTDNNIITTNFYTVRCLRMSTRVYVIYALYFSVLVCKPLLLAAFVLNKETTYLLTYLISSSPHLVASLVDEPS